LEEKESFLRYENFLVIIMFLVVGLVFLDRLSLGFVFPYMSTELGLSNTQLGLAVGLTGVFFGLSTLFFASISDFIGRKKMLLVMFVIIFSVATLLAGLVGSFATLLITRIIMGIAEGPVMPLVQSIVYAESSEKRRGMNMGIIQSASSLIGGTMAPVIAVALAINFGWRSSFIYIAIPGLIVGLILWRFLREPKIRQKVNSEATTDKPKREAYFNVFKQSNIWLSTIVGTCNMIYILTLTAFLPTLFATSTSFKEGQIQLLLGLMGFMMFVGQFSGSALSDRIGRLPVIKIFSFVSIFLPIAIYFSYQNFAFLLAGLIIFSLGNGYQPLIMNIVPAESVSRTFSATAISFVILTSEIIGGGLGPTLAGILADHFGPTAPLWITIVASVIAFICSFGIKETAPVKVAKSSGVSV